MSTILGSVGSHRKVQGLGVDAPWPLAASDDKATQPESWAEQLSFCKFAIA